MKSQARFLVERMADEAAVYDRLSGDTHYLNPLACAIYSLRSRSSDLSLANLAQCLGQPADAELDAAMRSAFEALQVLGLIAEDVDSGS